MSTFAEFVAAESHERPGPALEETRREPVIPDPIRDEQVQALVQQLFLAHDSPPLHHVGFSGTDIQAETPQLCLQAASVLAGLGAHDVALIDANLYSPPLCTQLDLKPARCVDTPWTISPRLWLVPRTSWLGDIPPQRIAELQLARLRDLTSEFDCTILCCPPVSWLAARVAQSCEGVVLVLTANRTRRLVAAQMKSMLENARIPLLGTVLTQRRFPVPSGLYRNL